MCVCVCVCVCFNMTHACLPLLLSTISEKNKLRALEYSFINVHDEGESFNFYVSFY